MIKTFAMVFVLPPLLEWLKREAPTKMIKDKSKSPVKKTSSTTALASSAGVLPVTPHDAPTTTTVATSSSGDIESKVIGDSLPPVVTPPQSLSIQVTSSATTSSFSGTITSLAAPQQLPPGTPLTPLSPSQVGNATRQDSLSDLRFTDADRAMVGLGLDSPTPSPSSPPPNLFAVRQQASSSSSSTAPSSSSITTPQRGGRGGQRGGRGRGRGRRQRSRNSDGWGSGGAPAPVVVGEDVNTTGGDASAARQGSVWQRRQGRGRGVGVGGGIVASGGAGIGTGTATSGVSAAIVRMCV
jgi:hypothetical protein